GLMAKQIEGLGHAAHRAGRRPAQRLTDDRVLLFAGIAFDVMAQAAENARAVMHDLAAAALDQDAPAALDDLADPLVVQAFEVQHLQGRVKILEREHRAQAASRLELAGSDEKHLQAGLASQRTRSRQLGSSTGVPPPKYRG